MDLRRQVKDGSGHHLGVPRHIAHAKLRLVASGKCHSLDFNEIGSAASNELCSVAV